MATDVMIQANGLTKRFGVVRALDKVNFEVKRGEVVGFLGPNGAGKSTTMRILTCFISPSTGSAKVNGTTCSTTRSRCVGPSATCRSARRCTRT